MRSSIVFYILAVVFLLSFSKTGRTQPAVDDTLSIGGALRYNIFLTDYGGNITTNDRHFTFDTWRLNVLAAKSDIQLDFEYRFYPTYATHFIHHGWFGTYIGENTHVKLGVTKVPFGALPFTSHSWWFSTAYYMGFEDDYDIGLTADYKNDPWNIQLGYFMQAEPNGPATLEYEGIQLANNTARYSYDVIETADQTNSERSQYNIRIAYKWKHGTESRTELGLSAEYGRLYNEVRQEFGNHQAYALHLDGDYGRWNIKAELLSYYYDAFNDRGRPLSAVQMGAYGFGTYSVAAEAALYIFGMSYELPLPWKWVDKVTLYEDITYISKNFSDFNNSVQHVIGFSFGVGDLYMYFDVASGKNHPWLNDTYGVGLGQGRANPRWNTRFNINIGYYF